MDVEAADSFPACPPIPVPLSPAPPCCFPSLPITSGCLLSRDPGIENEMAGLRPPGFPLHTPPHSIALPTLGSQNDQSVITLISSLSVKGLVRCDVCAGDKCWVS